MPRFGMMGGVWPRGYDPYAPGAAVSFNWRADRYRMDGARVDGFTTTALSGLSVARTHTNFTSAYARNRAGVLLPFAANTPRRTNMGLLVEEQRQDRQTRSQEFDNASWAKSQSSISANAGEAPDRTVTADKLVEDTALQSHFVTSGNAVTVANGASLAIGLFVKRMERTWCYFRTNNNLGDHGTWFDAETGQLGNPIGSPVSRTVEALADDWFRVNIAYTNVSGGSRASSMVLGLAPGNGLANYTGDGASGLLIWEAENQAGAFITSPIPTGSAAATRAADDIAWTRSAPAGDHRIAGTVTTTRAIGQARAVFDWNDGDDDDKVLLEIDASNRFVLKVVNVGVTTTVATEAGSPAAARTADFEVHRVGGNWSLYVDGVLAGTAAASAPAATEIQFGNTRALTAALNDWLESFAIYED